MGGKDKRGDRKREREEVQNLSKTTPRHQMVGYGPGLTLYRVGQKNRSVFES